MDYWKRLVDEYRKQTAWNEVVPLVIQQEYASLGEAARRQDTEALDILDDLFRYLREQRIRVVTMAEAVDLFRKAHPDTTPPTYALFDNLGAQGLPASPVAHPKTGRLQRLEVTSNRISKARSGVAFNGYYASELQQGVRSYYDPEGRAYTRQGKLLAYYDVNGLLMFEEGRSQPVRITSYTSLPENPHEPRVLPEMSAWFNTQDKIPAVDLTVTKRMGSIEISARASWERSAVFGSERQAYGLMLWGGLLRLPLARQGPGRQPHPGPDRPVPGVPADPGREPARPDVEPLKRLHNSVLKRHVWVPNKAKMVLPGGGGSVSFSFRAGC